MATLTYEYRVRDRSGKVVSGTLEADSQAAVVGRLKEMGYAPLLVQEQKSSLGKTEIKLPFGGKVKQKHLSVMSRQFATMIDSGLSLLRALNILAEQTESPKLAETLQHVRADVEKGQSLSQALGKHPKVFNRLYVAMIKSGESGGALDSVLNRLAEMLEKEVALRQKIKSAMTYPVVVAGFVILIVTGMLMFIVPMFKGLYDELGGTLPLPTRVLIGVSDAIKGMWFVWMPILFGGPFAFKRWITTDRGRQTWDRVKLKVPVFGSLVHKTALSRFSRTLSSLMRSGVPILQGLEIVKDTVNNAVVARAVARVQSSVKEGASMARPLLEHGVFPPMVVQMMIVGEETGALDTMLDKIADFYDQEVDSTVEALTSLIEPALIVLLGLSVGGMVIALYMPMFNIINLVK